jgi:predicted ribosomally synthesized peptide with nif11-like leader
MSKKQAEDFIEKIKNDDAFREEVMSIRDVKNKIGYINRQGFFFTSDELKNAWFSMSKTRTSAYTSQ